MRALRPLVVEDAGGFRVFHNDVRVHLTRLISGSQQRIAEVSGKMADYYIQAPETSIARHADLFRLLSISGRQRDHAIVFSPEYVLEGWALGRPMSELIDQCNLALHAVPSVNDWDAVHRVTCAIHTLNQLRKSLQWSDRGETGNPSVEEIPPVLITEGRVLAKETWSLDLTDGVAEDALALAHGDQVDRASGLVSRWFQTMSPVEVLRCLPESDQKESWPQVRQEGEEGLSSAARAFYTTWGRVSQYTGILWEMTSYDGLTPLEQATVAAFFSGWLLEAAIQPGPMNWAHSLQSVRSVFYSDVEEAIVTLAGNQHWGQVAYALKHITPHRSELSKTFRVQAATWSLVCNRQDLVDLWVNPLLVEAFMDLQPARVGGYTDELHNFIRVCFILGWTAPVRPAAAIVEEAVAAFYAKNRDERQKPNVVRLFRAGAVIGRSLGACITKGRDYATQTSDPKDLRDVLQAIVSPDPRPAAYPNGYYELTAELVELAVECGNRIGGEFDKVVANVLFGYAERFRVDATLEPTWRFVASRGGGDVLQRWFDHWVAEDGAVWSMDVAERLETIERLSSLATELGWAHQVAKLDTRQRWGWVGYSGHKEYALGEPLGWFKDLAAVSPMSWEDLGLRLLAVSREASQTGDNRLSLDVTDAVASAAARCGAASAWKLLNCGSTKAQTAWMGNRDAGILEGIAAMLKDQGGALAEQDLYVIWCIAMGAAAWEAEHERAEIWRVKQALLREAQRRCLPNVAARMQQLGPTECDTQASRYERHTEVEPSIVLVEQVAGVSIDEAIALVTERVSSASYVSTNEWRAVAACLTRLRDERPPGFQQHLDALDQTISRRSSRYGWTDDGVRHAFEALVPLLDETTRFRLVQDIITALDFNGSSEIWMYAAAENLDLLCLYRARISGEAAIGSGLDRLLTMHELWIEGGGRLPSLNRPVLPDQIDPPNTWSEFGYRFMLGKISSSGSSLTVAAALRGLWALCQVSPDDLGIVRVSWEQLTERAQEWILLVAERVASLTPHAFPTIEPIVTSSYQSTTLLLKLQAWVVLTAYERNGGTACPSWSMVDPSVDEHAHVPVVDGATTILKVPGTQRGSTVFVQGMSAVSGVLARLEAATEDDVSDLETKLSKSLRAQPIASSRRTSSHDRDPDMLIVQTAELNRLRQLIFRELSEGRWSDVPVARIAQALLPSDDPYVLLRTPVPHRTHTWPSDEALDELLSSPTGKAKLERQLTDVLGAGLNDDQLLLGARLWTFSRHWDVRFSLDYLWKRDVSDLTFIERIPTFSGRTFSTYETDRFEPDLDMRGGWLTLDTLGIGVFMNQFVQCIPSLMCEEVGGWHPSPSDPLAWLEEGKPVMEMQFKLGPIRTESRDLPGRQPQLQRWVVSKSSFERLRSKLGGSVSMRNHLLSCPFGGEP